jgi:hypothetical protein
MITVEEFKVLCRERDVNDIVNDVLLAEEALHVPLADRNFISAQLARKYGIEATRVRLWITGSSKLGFSIVEKSKNGRKLPRYRPFGPDSDIDVAIISPDIFNMIWEDLCVFAHGEAWIPWDSRALGDYMIYGWLRPDHFPHGKTRRGDDWWDVFRALSLDTRFKRRQVRGGLFHSVGDLHRYLRRAVIECVNIETSRS